MKHSKDIRVAQVARQKTDKIERQLRQHRTTRTVTAELAPKTLRITPLGGQNGIGEKNMIVVEYENDALILDCGFELGIDLPGINYAIPVTDYLKTIKHKIRGYIISHGHMDHIGALVHTVPEYPAPIFGSRFTIGMVEAQFEKINEQGNGFAPEVVVIDMDAHQKVTLGAFVVELIRVTHAIPESSAISVQTPFGRLINTGDFRLDPEPLDDMPSDIARLKELGDEGVLMLMSESTNTTKLGRTPTEHTLQDSFYELVGRTHGRLIVAIFSTNMNRVQMIINAAHQYGRKVVLDGRSMYAVAELAVRLGNLKIPKGVLISMDEAVRLKEEELVVICTGGQGEPGAALSRMAAGEHRVLTLKNTDSVVISSTPIPGNERRYASLGDQLARIGVIQYRHPTHEIDGSGPLHVSGHAARDEHAEMIQLTRPTFLMPIYGGPLNRKYHRDIGIAEGIPSDHIVMADNGSMIELRAGITPVVMGKVTAGAHLVDQTGSVVPEIVTRDRLLLKEDGFIVIVLTVDKNGRVLSHPDILTRGCLAVKDNPNIIEALRKEMRTVLKKHPALHSRVTVDIFKQKLRIAIGRSVFQATQTVPIVIPVVNVVHQNGSTNIHPKPSADVH